jgi:hypothetical protein
MFARATLIRAICANLCVWVCQPEAHLARSRRELTVVRKLSIQTEGFLVVRFVRPSKVLHDKRLAQPT